MEALGPAPGRPRRSPPASKPGSMDFSSEAQRECYQRILPWLEELFGGSLVVHQSLPEFGIMVGSAFAQITLTPFQNDILICTRAYVVIGADLRYDLLEFLLHQNHYVVVGAFGLSPKGEIFYQHSILGSTCDQPELEASVLAVALLADRYDDRIRSQWGGQRALDRAHHR